MNSPPASPGTIVIALGGNALQPPGARVTIADQFRHTRESVTVVVELAREGWRIAIVHGNGPQVGDALERNEEATGMEPLPLGVLVAATAGWIGYMIQQSLMNALRVQGINRDVLTIINQTVVDTVAGGGMEPTKPIGHALRPELVERYRARGVPVGRDAVGNWRRLAPSPIPIDLVEADAVRQLVLQGKIVIAGGGGGSPVYWDERLGWEGIDAVVDKDRVAGILATRLEADTLMILTNVDAVYSGWGTPEQAPIRKMGVAEAEALLAGGALGAGSMEPKVEAAVGFVRNGGRRAVIADLGHGRAALRGETGTTIIGDGV